MENLPSLRKEFKSAKGFYNLNRKSGTGDQRPHSLKTFERVSGGRDYHEIEKQADSVVPEAKSQKQVLPWVSWGQAVERGPPFPQRDPVTSTCFVQYITLRFIETGVY